MNEYALLTWMMNVFWFDVLRSTHWSVAYNLLTDQWYWWKARTSGKYVIGCVWAGQWCRWAGAATQVGRDSGMDGQEQWCGWEGAVMPMGGDSYDRKIISADFTSSQKREKRKRNNQKWMPRLSWIELKWAVKQKSMFPVKRHSPLRWWIFFQFRRYRKGDPWFRIEQFSLVWEAGFGI